MAVETCASGSEELVSGSHNENDEPMSPEIPVQSKRKETNSLSLVPRWCYEEGLVKKPQFTKMKGTGRRFLSSDVNSEADADEVKERLEEIKSVLKH